MILDYEMLLYKINIEKEKVRKRNVNLKEIKEEVYTEVMISKNALNNSKKLVVFINNFDQNSFIWSKRIIFNTSIKEGTMLSYVDYFQSLGYDIILANPNQNLFYNGKPIYDNQNNNKFNTLIIPNHDTYENHIITLFKDIIFPSNPNQLYIIGHGDASNGIIELINQYPIESINYIKAIALIDSTHSIYSINEENQLWFAGNVFHWLKLGENITEESINKLTSRFGCNCFSAGNYLNEESIPQLKYEISSFFESH
ncbi:hypothetical protein K502DRAFT_328095 [Neoconidiobolus thromboides FSU 785]|nr:hypothetical protein K502DRAFT_328095 [Neoconidiobolus thromboides FSU 785]